VNTLLSATDYAFMLEHSRARAAFVGAPLLATLQAALGEARHEVGAGGGGRARDAAPAAAIDLEELLARTDPLAAPADTGADEPGFWLYSSGSTGRPRGAGHTHAHPRGGADRE